MHPYPQQYLISNEPTDELAKKNHSVIIIGGDTMALALAHYLSQYHDADNILIVSPDSLGANIKNRQCALVRANYQTGANTSFFEINLKLWENLSSDLGYNVMLSQLGLIQLLLNNKMIKTARYRGNAMRLHGIDADYLELAEMRRLLPLLDFSATARFSILASLHQGRAGFFNPMAAFYAFWHGLSPRRVKIIERVEMKDIVFNQQGRRAVGVKVVKNGKVHELRGQKIVLAMADGGANLIARAPDIKKLFAKELTSYFGQAMPKNNKDQANIYPFLPAQEVELLSESLSPMLNKIIQFPLPIGGGANLSGGVGSAYIGQAELGNIWLRFFMRRPPTKLGMADGTRDANIFSHFEDVDGIDDISLIQQELARGAVQLLPALARVKVLTQWHQTFLSSFDGSPIIDKFFNKEDLYIISGIDGDGYAMAPAATMAMAHLIATNQPHPAAADYGFQRFIKGQFLYEKAV